MMDCTDRHQRYLLRLISRHALLYAEMLTCQALVHGDSSRLLAFDPCEHPVAAQLGGSDPQVMAACARLVESAGYDEVNINVGCPSSRVQSGAFGACLMARPERVAECVEAMRAAVAIPVTVKTRIGIDHQDSYPALVHFVETVAAAGCGVFVVHARKAWLSGLSPKENRRVPPLRHDWVHRLKQDLPALSIVLNGGISTLDQVEGHLRDPGAVDGVMIGRQAYHDPYLLADVDRRFYGEAGPVRSRREVAVAYLPYIERELSRGACLGQIARHLLGLFQGVPGARAWRRLLTEQARRPDAGPEVVEQALERVL